MAERTRLGLRDVRGLQSGETIWDSAVPGFGARRQRSAAIAYVLIYRTAEGRQRFHTIGRHGAPWTPDTARDVARRLLGEVAAGRDPGAEKHEKRKALSVNDLCDRYLAEVTAGRLLVRGGKPKKPSTIASDLGRINGHIRPLLGRLSVAAVTRADVERFMHAVAAGETAKRAKTRPRGLSVVRGGRGVATRAVALLGAILTYAVQQGLRHDNPAHGIRKYAEGRRERRLSDEEYSALGRALRQADNLVWPAAVAATRFLVVTGWRRGEALGLRWADVDLTRRVAVLADTKSGRSIRPLSLSACHLLREMPRLGALVFPATRGSGPMAGFFKLWRRIAKLGALPIDVSPHALRHSFASLAADMGYSEPTIGAMIGHKGHSVTARYMHSADAVLLAAANAVARRTLELMGGECACADSVLPLYVDRIG